MVYNVNIILSLAIFLFIFYSSVEALESNDVTDYNSRKKGEKGDILKEKASEVGATPELKTKSFSSPFKSSSTRLTKMTSIPSHAEFAATSVIRNKGPPVSPTLSSQIVPPDGSTVTPKSKKSSSTVTPPTKSGPSNSTAIDSLTQKRIASDATMHATFEHAETSYTTVPPDITLSHRTGSFHSMVSVTASLRTVVSETVAESSDVVHPSRLGDFLTLSSEIRDTMKLPSSVPPTVVAYSSQLFSNIVSSSSSTSAMLSHTTSNSSRVMSELTKSFPTLVVGLQSTAVSGRLMPTESTSLAVESTNFAFPFKKIVTSSMKINQETQNISIKAMPASNVAPTVSENNHTEVIVVETNSVPTDSRARTEIRWSTSLNASQFHSKTINPDSNVYMDLTSSSEYPRTSYISKQYSSESGLSDVKSSFGIEATVKSRISPAPTSIDVERTTHATEAQPFSTRSALYTPSLDGQQVSSLSQAQSAVLGPKITAIIDSTAVSTTTSLLSTIPLYDVINITHATASVTPKMHFSHALTKESPLRSVNTVITNRSSIVTVETTEAKMERISTDVATAVSHLTPVLTKTPSYEVSRNQPQQNASLPFVWESSPILSTAFGQKHLHGTSASFLIPLNQSRTSFSVINPSPTSFFSTGRVSTKSTPLDSKISSRLRGTRPSLIPSMGSTVHKNSIISQSVALPDKTFSSMYTDRLPRPSVPVSASIEQLTARASTILQSNSTSFLTAASVSKTKTVVGTSTSRVMLTTATTRVTAATARTTAMTSSKPVVTERTTPKERPVTEPRTTSQQPVYIGEPKIHTKLLAKYPTALNIEFHVSFPGLSEAYKVQIIAQKYNGRIIADNGKRLRTWYEVHYFEDHKHEPYIVVELTEKHIVRRPTFNFTIGRDTQCEVKQVRFRYCNGPLHKGAYRFSLFYHVHGKIKRSAFSKVYTTATVATAPPDENSGLNQSSITIAVIAVLAVLLVIIVVIAVVLYRRKNSSHNDNYGDTEVSDCTLLTSLKRTSSCSKSCYGRGDLGTADSSVLLKSLTKAMSRPVHVKDFIAWVMRSQADSDFRFAEEFESVRDVGRDQIHEASDVPENRGKNRYVNVLAYDRTRVKLSYTDDEVGSDYINANYIHGHNHPRAYIATQGPLPGTTDDFWRMIWEQNTFIIVMATQCVERNRVKCHQYWPGIQPTAYGDIVVSLLSENANPEWIEREFLLEVDEEGSRRIHHFQYIAWPDHGVPKAASTALDFIHTVRSHVIPGHGPVVVHCSAGVGRTGTLIAIDTILDRLQEEDTIDVYLCVCLMRLQRCSMVQTEEQYIFIHRVLVEYLKSRNTASLLKGYSLLPKEDDDNDLESEGCPSTNRDSGLALLLSEYDTEHIEEALESIA